MLKEGDRDNFETLRQAVLNGDCCLMECSDKKDGSYVAVVCAVNRVDGEFEMAPLARLFTHNPYEEVDPPCTDGRKTTS